MADQNKYEPVNTLEEPVSMVVIVAHHDDIEFGCAGSVARWVAEGATVTYVIVTDGSAGSNEVGIAREYLTKRRREEQIAAASAVGVHDVRFLGYQDGVLEPTIQLRRDLTRIIRQVKPYRVICQDPTTVFAGDFYINHPDHRAAGEAAIYATFPSSESRPIFPELLDEGLEPHKVGELFLNLSMKPTHYVDISDYIEQKMAALSQHQSQIGDLEAAEKGALKFVRKMNSENGENAGVGYAEMFKVMKFDQPREEDKQSEEEGAAMADAISGGEKDHVAG